MPHKINTSLLLYNFKSDLNLFVTDNKMLNDLF